MLSITASVILAGDVETLQNRSPLCEEGMGKVKQTSNRSHPKCEDCDYMQFNYVNQIVYFPLEPNFCMYIPNTLQLVF